VRIADRFTNIEPVKQENAHSATVCGIYRILHQKIVNGRLVLKFLYSLA